ncbi:efflux RND transporter periplasmic adaptor subunit [Phreatobacter sp. AB_2022a]|uniref:efflux RND transporter periplasmic adaptor subunit n=1 Tax=Phreatobacter sp. AB_2022a TaxID=3003134 RepID=UPI00228746D3|nr:efflux RND transporter periplasmic adaptor subunit [Phreatobacter sp. AB_2022a]MCZ0734997.1 efflux RND transporter periplasmic adaptor subunit [Phreatobacter sp. AB_2022a]
MTRFTSRPAFRLKACTVLLAVLMAAPLAAPGAARAAPEPASTPRPPSVTVATAARGELRDLVIVTGSFVAREEVLISPEVDGLAIVEILAEEGDRVEAGQVLARLNRAMLDVQLAQNAAQIARAEASIAQSHASIAEATATKSLSDQQLQRTRQLQTSGVASNDQLDQRLSASRAAAARLEAANHALQLGEADLTLARAQRRDIELRIARSEIRTPVAGIVSRRTARQGMVATAAGEPLFRVMSGGLIELEGDVPETTLAKLRPEQGAAIDAAGSDQPLPGRVRLVAPEVNRTNRLGRVRIALTGDARPPVGAFGRALVEVARSEGVLVPLSAVMFAQGAITVQVVRDGVVETRPVVPGLRADNRIEIREGLKAGEQVVAVSGSFVRNGDRVTPVALATR